MRSDSASASLTHYVAEFAAQARYEAIPPEVVHLGKKSILDGLGCALSGSKAHAIEILRRHLNRYRCAGQEQGREAGAPAIGTSVRLPPQFAALVNGTAIHVDDYDDTQQAATGKFQGVHPTAPVLASLLALGEERASSGRDVLAAYLVGVEIACKLFDATAPDHILSGYHGTGTTGMLGAAATCGRLLGLDIEQLRMTLGIAASQTSGLQRNFGTMTKPLHAGRSAEAGIVAAELAAAGFTASPIILEAPQGFFRTEGGPYEPERIESRLGNPWAFVDRGVWLKPWPTGSLSHPAMTLMLNLVRAHDIHPEQVTAIRVRTSENIHRTLLHHRPKTELEAKFSLEFCLAGLLLDRKLGLGAFTDDYVVRPEIQALIARVAYTTFNEEQAREAGYTIVTSFVEIELKDGRRIGDRIDFGKGSLADPMDDAEVEAKFRDCAGFAGWPAAKTDRIIGLIAGLETLPDLRELSGCLGGARG